MEELIEKYVALRDAKAVHKKAYEAKIEKIDAVMEKIEAIILNEFNESGVESVRTPSGTAYKQIRTSASVADWDAYFSWLQNNEAWHMLDHRVSKEAVVQYRNEHNDLPPGLNWREETVINVRRS